MDRPTVKSRPKVWESALCAIALAVAVGSVFPNRAPAQDEIQKARAEAGRVWYDQYCTPCHGVGGTPGSALRSDTKQPTDLRTYVQRHGGKFPAGEWLAVVFGPQPGRVHSEVWEKIRNEHQTSGGPVNDATARGIVAMIADYVITVQTK